MDIDNFPVEQLIPYLIPLAILVYFLISSLKIIKEHERIAIFRLAKFMKIVSPGLVLVIHPIDKGIKVNLNEIIPGWHSNSKTELVIIRHF